MALLRLQSEEHLVFTIVSFAEKASGLEKIAGADFLAGNIFTGVCALSAIARETSGARGQGRDLAQ